MLKGKSINGGMTEMVMNGATNLYDYGKGAAASLSAAAASFGIPGIVKFGVPIYDLLNKLSPKAVKAL